MPEVIDSIHEAVYFAVEGQRVLWISLVRDQWRHFNLLRDETFKCVTLDCYSWYKRYIEFKSGGRIDLVSTDTRSLRGRSADIVFGTVVHLHDIQALTATSKNPHPYRPIYIHEVRNEDPEDPTQ